jgi:hypothetical protein
MAFFDARSCSVQYVVFDPSTGRCAPVDPVLDYDEKSVPTAAPSADALLAFACESETSRLNEFAILITCGSLKAVTEYLSGNTAVATYKDTYDILIMGERRAHTIIATDTFVKMSGEWKQVVSHGSVAK